MRSWLTYIFLLLAGIFMGTSCLDDSFENCPEDMPVVHLRISLPGSGSRVGGDYQDGVYNNNLDPETEDQRMIANDDIYVLQFDADGKLFHVVTDLSIDEKNGNAERTLTGHLLTSEGNVKLVVLANLNQQDGIDGITPQSLLNTYKGETEQTIYSALVYNYNYPSGGNLFWDLDNRRLPMWGATNPFTITAVNNVNCNLYRGVAKMGIQVDDECDEFTLKEVYVYYANNKGYCAAPTKRPNETETIQFTEPEIPISDVAQSANPITYTFEATKSFLNQIYLSEVDNTNPEAGKKELKVVVGGVYTGSGLVGEDATSYYRIDMEDDKDRDGVLAPFDIIRNHSYIFNITKVENPGTPTPDEALDEAVVGLTVVVEDWTDEYMRGVPDQYTLTTNKSVITYEAYNDKNGQTIDIWTDYSDGWYLEGLDEAESAWLNISANSGVDNETKTITLTPKADNNGVTRTASFYVVAGNIKKEITVRQPQPPTANCYVRGDGTYELIVTIKGNGNDGILPEGADIVPGDGDASITPDKIGIIWETEAGLVELLNPSGQPVTNTEGELSLVDYNKTTNSIKYKVDITGTGASIGGAQGGNALIGAFNAAGEVIWSWHIWVSPDLIDPETQIVKENYVEKWTLNDYDVLDRNLGALANRPINNNSVASMGLLYQWGRKDPFIGAAYSNDNFTGTGLLNVVHYYENWNTARITINSTAINTAIAHPTRMIYGGTNNNPTGLSSMAENGGFLWGTNNGLSTTVKDLGSKTIYDPCPVGYRVPPVDAFVFVKKVEDYNYTLLETITLSPGATSSSIYSNDIWYRRKRSDRNNYDDYSRDDINENGYIKNPSNNRTYNYQIYRRTSNIISQNTSEKDNWDDNLLYIPHKVSAEFTYESSYGDYDVHYWYGSYVNNANYYGFWLNYAEIERPELASGSYTDNNTHYDLKDYTNLTWLPLTGAYDPTQGFNLKEGTIEGFSSITVNSFLWTNSSVLNGTGNSAQTIPAAMFLHGAETGTGGDGRHIHGMTQSNIKAEPHYAGAVRCVRDRAKTKWDINSLSSTASIRNTAGSTTTINIVSVNADWELIDPGQPWLQVTPDKGTADKGSGTTITLKMLEAGHSGETATLVFKIANETETRSCVVTVQ